MPEITASNNPFPSILVEETASASVPTPSAGQQRIFIDTSDHHKKRKNSSGTVTDLEPGGTVTHTGGALTSGKTVVGAGSADVAVSSLTAQFVGSSSGTQAAASMSTARLLGRTTASSGAVEEISVGSGLSLAAGSLSATGGTGDVVGPGSAVDSRIAVFDGATGKLIKDGGSTIASIVAGAGVTPIGLVNGRLTTETAVPVSLSDRTSQSTIYFTPYLGNQIGLYTGSTWTVATFSEMSLALSGLTSGKNYDVFVDYNSGSPQLVLSAAWTNDTTRADAIALQDGIYVKSGTPAYRHVGTIRTTGTTTTEDSLAKRFVWNRYNQAARPMRVLEATDSWSYGTTTIRQTNGSSANQLDYVTGDDATFIEAIAQSLIVSSSAAFVGIGVDTTSAFTPGGVLGQTANGSGSTVSAMWKGYPGLGRHFLSWNERGNGVSLTWFGDNGAPTIQQSGIVGSLWN